jgi:hypothetical protein
MLMIVASQLRQDAGLQRAGHPDPAFVAALADAAVRLGGRNILIHAVERSLARM